MEKPLYFAYGSNINLGQMQYRCPDATVRGAAILEGYELVFRGSGIATIAPKEGACVHGLLWELTDRSEASLDRYEGFPRLYRKEYLQAQTEDGKTVPIMAYVIDPALELRPAVPPSGYYYGIQEGYLQNRLPLRKLKQALRNCLTECGIQPRTDKTQTLRKKAQHER